MIPSGSPNPTGGTPSMNPSLIRTNSGMMVTGGQAGSMASQQLFPSMVSQRSQFGNGANNMSLLGNLSNVTTLLNQSFANGGQGSGLSASQINIHQRGVGGVVDMVPSVEQDPLSFISGQSQNQQFQNPSGAHLASENAQVQQVVDNTMQNFQQQFSVPHNRQQSLQSALGNVASVKLEQQMGGSDQNGPSQQLQTLRNLSSVKSETQQLQPMRSSGPVKLEQHSDPSLFLQQQQLLHLSRQTSQAAQMSMLQQQQQHQRLLQIQQQQQQQQQLLKALPQQRPQLQQQQQQQQQLQQQAMSLRSLVKPSVYEPGTCARRLTQYMYHQQHRPADNNIDFWRKFVNEYFSPHAKKRWCVSLYGSGRQTTGVFPQDVWHCEICNRKPGRGFETTVEVLPRLLKIKYDSGTLEELLYVDMPREYQNASGQIVLDYAKAIQESVFEQLRVVRDGQLRIVFSSDLKICSWEFCARRHEELIPRRVIIHQVGQLGVLAQKYQSAAQNAASTSGLSSQELQSTCDSFVASARQMTKALEVPLVNDLGYTKRYVRCLQISEVVNSMKDLIDYSKETGTGPMASLVNFPRKTSASSALHVQTPHSEEQQPMSQAPSQNDPRSLQTSGMQLASGGSGSIPINNSIKPTPAMASAGTVLLRQNSTNSRQENSINNMNNPYGGGNAIQIPSTSSSNSLPYSQPNPSSFPSSTPSASNNSNNNNGPPTSNGNHVTSANSPANMPMLQQTQHQLPLLGHSNYADMNDSQSSVQQIIQEMMMSSQLNGITQFGNDVKVINGSTPGFNGGNCFVGNGITNRSNISGMGYGSISGIVASPTATTIRATMANSGMFNERLGMNPMVQDLAFNQQQQQLQQDMGNRLLNSGLGAANNFNNLQFDWKSNR